MLEDGLLRYVLTLGLPSVRDDCPLAPPAASPRLGLCVWRPAPQATQMPQVSGATGEPWSNVGQPSLSPSPIVSRCCLTTPTVSIVCRFRHRRLCSMSERACLFQSFFLLSALVKQCDVGTVDNLILRIYGRVSLALCSSGRAGSP